MDFLKIKDQRNQNDSFKAIAEKLFNEYVIQTNKRKLYRITEIEFYWNSTNHQDNSTYVRKHVTPKLGDWFFHYSGVDIALDDEFGHGRGGILIRSIMDINEKELIKGPLVVMIKLFNGNNAFKDANYAKIIPHNFIKAIPKTTTRIGLGKNAKENGFDNEMYRFFINPK